MGAPRSGKHKNAHKLQMPQQTRNHAHQGMPQGISVVVVNWLQTALTEQFAPAPTWAQIMLWSEVLWQDLMISSLLAPSGAPPLPFLPVANRRGLNSLRTTGREEMLPSTVTQSHEMF
mmetsp:Transcript_3475/g.5770  ORF Transcript_3475/g.5770 Transcript_3475/m.5770 type:complete len:118 (-) Transcript_3475:277-630(-)